MGNKPGNTHQSSDDHSVDDHSVDDHSVDDHSIDNSNSGNKFDNITSIGTINVSSRRQLQSSRCLIPVESSSKSSIDISSDVQLFRTLSRANPSGNLFVSPLSIRSALAMVYLGARGNTADQMEKALSFSSDEAVHAKFKKLIEDIHSPSVSYILKIANRLYGEQTAMFLPRFLEAMCKYFHSDLKTVDFLCAVEASRKEINTWVEQQTENKIKDLLKPGIVSAGTRLVLVNAIYLKANWKNRFYKANTKEMPFKVSQTECKPVQMMIQIEKLPYNYIPEYSLQILELPFEKEELSMFILLPEQSTDCSDPLLKLEMELTLEMLNEWTDRKNMDVQSDIHVHLPKFKLEEDYDLKEPLSELGMTDVFCPSKADLSGMNGEAGLFLSTVIHKAFMEVNEEGTEAAGATAAIGLDRCMLRVKPFTADHPFLFFIRHNQTGAIFFLGRYASPQ
ncbi:leukocyte elastase inhibitor [Pleuronectes platessa]|uniref:leukocyte elastase inhibitor n=1 Tax=Pleuronectes platessa TaxID=8262 RepID=UPI00232A449A|nr:leukocyte elastase inhibitor [Pleuronectes platessa]